MMARRCSDCAVCPKLWHSLERQESVGYPGVLGSMLAEYVRNLRTVGALKERRHQKMNEVETVVVSVLLRKVQAEVLTRKED